MKRIVKITGCHECPYVDDVVFAKDDIVFFCGRMNSRMCPPTGTPDWCPLEAIEDAGGAR